MMEGTGNGVGVTVRAGKVYVILGRLFTPWGSKFANIWPRELGITSFQVVMAYRDAERRN
jgi:hypothetical protein